MRNKRKNINRRGVVLLVVLFVVMAITILSVSFIAQSDMELSVGENMVLRTEMDYLAESGLEHARGLILNPQDVSSAYWTGAVGQQLVAGSDDYYDVSVTKLGECNYRINSEAYRKKAGVKVGRSRFSSELRLDPCITYWVNTTDSQRLSSGVTINGDVYCGGSLMNSGVINGDVFSSGLNGIIVGQHKAIGELALEWPRVISEDFLANYTEETIGNNYLPTGTVLPITEVQICHRNGSLELADVVMVDAMLIVKDDLIIEGSGNVIVAPKNLPALLVGGDVIIEEGGSIDIFGLAVVNGTVRVNADAAGFNVFGGLFVEAGTIETGTDSTGNDHIINVYNGPGWEPFGGQTAGALRFDGVDDTAEDESAAAYLNGLNALTVSLWLKSDVAGSDRGILFGRAPTGFDTELGIRYDKTGHFGGGTNIIKASIRTTSGYTQIESTSNVQTTDWQHVALVWESSGSPKLYIDGNLNLLSYEGPALAGGISGIEKLVFGQGAKGNYWAGLVDDIRIYNWALSADDIYPPTDGLSGLVSHWKMDEQGFYNIMIVAAPSDSAIVAWSEEGVAEKWGPSAGAFFRSIERQ
ncbi:MAG: LamG domain-containing protein [Planctomycetota bacterium]|jgi:hypothetical protein